MDSLISYHIVDCNKMFNKLWLICKISKFFYKKKKNLKFKLDNNCIITHKANQHKNKCDGQNGNFE